MYLFTLKSLWVSAFPCLLTCMPSTVLVDMQWLFEVIPICLSKCTCTVGANRASVQHLRVKGKYQEQALGPCCSCLTKLLVPSYLFCSKCTLFLCLFTPVFLPCRPRKNLMHKPSAPPQKHREHCMLYLLADLTLLVEVVVDLQQLFSLFCFSCLVRLLSFCSIVLCFHYTRLCKLIVHTNCP